ncbi:MAG: Asp23/Gls24 family envelope stress response protein [Ornithinimicrobium sp.]
MSTIDQTPASTHENTPSANQASSSQEEPKQLDALHTEHGDTMISDEVVQKLAGIAAREVPGVHAMGSAAGRAVSSLTQRIPGQKPPVTGGVGVKKGERETAIEVSIIVEYGVSIVQVADSIRDNVIQAVEYATGLDVVEVNVEVTDVHLPGEDEDEDQTREQDRSDQLR